MRISAGKSGPKTQTTASSVFHVVEGSGSSIIEGKEYIWKKGDTFCVPAWHENQHHAAEGKTVYLYRIHDEPMIKALGFYRVNGQDVESLVSQ